MRRHRLVGALLVGLTVAACGGGGAESNEVALVREATVVGDLPSPTGEVVLDITKPDGTSTAFDLALLEQLRTVEATIREPFIDEDHRFTGVQMDDLLAAVGGGDAGAVTMTALDDYVVTFTPGELAGAILATRDDGEAIAIVDGGPIRIVFLPSSDIGRNEDLWIWSVRTMVLE